MRFYLGGGGQFGIKDDSNGGGSFGGEVGVLGLDYKFQKLPINLSIDWQPAYQFGETDDFTGDFGGIAVRFAF